MKIAVATTEYPSEITPNSGTFVRLNAQALAANHEVMVVHLVPPTGDDGEKDFMDGPVRVRRFPNPLLHEEDMVSGARILESIAHGVDLLHTMTLRTIAPFGINMDEELQIACPWVHSEQWSTTTPQGWPAEAEPVEDILVRADGLSTVSEVLAKDIREKRYNGPTHVVPFIIPMRGEVVERSVQSGKIRLVTGGSVSIRHQPEAAVRTVRALRQEGIDATLTWVGEGSAKPRAQAKIDEYKLGDYIKFITPGEPGLMEKEIDAADVFLGTTKEENFYMPCAQSLMQGRPVVVSGTGGHLEYLDESCSEVVEGKLSKDFAAAIKKVLEKTAGMSAQDISATVSGRFTAEAVAAKYDELYAETFRMGGWSV